MSSKADSDGMSDLPKTRLRRKRGTFAGGESPNSQVSDAEKPPPPKRRNLRASPVAKGATSLQEDSIVVRVSSPSEDERPRTSQPVLPKDSPLRVHSDLKPKPRSWPRVTKTASSRRSSKEHTDTLTAKERSSIFKAAGSQPEQVEKQDDESARHRRIVELEQERDDYRAGLHKEKAKSAELGQQILLLQSSRLTAYDDNVTAQIGDLQRQRQEAAASLRAVQDEKTTLTRKTEALEAEVTRLTCELKSQQSGAESRQNLLRSTVALDQQLREGKDAMLNMDATPRKMGVLKRTIGKFDPETYSKTKEGEHANSQIDTLRSDAENLKRKLLSLQSSKDEVTKQLEFTQKEHVKSRPRILGLLHQDRINELKRHRDALSQSLTATRKALKEVESEMEMEALRDSTARLQRERDEHDRKMRQKDDDMRDMEKAFKAEENRTKRTLQESEETQKTLVKKYNEQEQETRNMAAKILDLQVRARRTELALEEEKEKKSKLARTMEGLQAHIDRMQLTLRKEEAKNKTLTRESGEQQRRTREGLQACIDRLKLASRQGEEEKKKLAKESREQKDKMRDLSATIEGLRASADRFKLAAREEHEEKKRLAKEMREVLSAWLTGRLVSPS